MRKVLPLNREIPYGGMCRDRNRIIAITSSPDKMPWYINSFIPQIMYDTYNIHCYDTDNSYEVFDIYDEVAEFSFIKIKENDISSVISALMNDEYVLVNWDRYFIKQSEEFMQEHLYHEALIFGFDSEKETLLFHDSLINGKEFDVGEITYDNFINSIRESLKVVSKFEAKHWQYAFGHPFSKFSVRSTQTEINLRKMYHKYYTELRGVEINQKSKGEEEKSFKGGIMVFSGIERLLKDVDANYEVLNTYSNALWGIKLMSQHIKSHELRFKYLFENGIATKNDEILERINSTSKKMMIFFSVLNKYSVFHSEKDIKKCFELLSIVKVEYEHMLLLALKIIGQAIELQIV